MIVAGPDFDSGEMKETTLVLKIVGDGSGSDRLTEFGLLLMEEDGAVKLDEPMFGTPFADTMQGFDFYADDPVVIASVKAPADQFPKEIMYIPALLLLGLVALAQRRRQRKEPTGEMA